MGFPASFSDQELPKLLLHLLFLLGFLRNLIYRALDAAGLGDLVDDPNTPPPSTSPSNHQTGYALPSRFSDSRSASKLLLQELLPLSLYDELAETDTRGDPPDSCAVCLYEFRPGEEVRQLSNCKHVFHRFCLDPWVALDQRTCPLCRSPLVPEEMGGLFQDDGPWAAAAATPDSFSYYDDYGDYYTNDYHDEVDYYDFQSRTDASTLPLPRLSAFSSDF